MTSDEAVQRLNALEQGDNETAHGQAVGILLAVLDQLSPRVSAAWRDAQDRIGFWYA